MALIALAADKGAPGVTTAATALGAVWPRPVLLAECDQAGGDLVYRLPAEGGGMLNPSRGILSLAAVARRGLRAEQLYEHSQRLAGGLDVLVGVNSSEQAQALKWLWGPLGRAFALGGGGAVAAQGEPGSFHSGPMPPAGGAPSQANGAGPQSTFDVLADCGRLSPGSPLIELLREASMIVLFARATLEQIAHLRERITGLAAEMTGQARGSHATEAAPPVPIGIVVLADSREYRASIQEVTRIIQHAKLPASVLGGFILDPKGAEMLRDQRGGRLDRTPLIQSATRTTQAIIAHLSRTTGQPIPTGRR